MFSFIRSFLNKQLISIILHYSYRKSMKLLPKDTLNSKLVPVCESLPYLYMLRQKYITIDETTPHMFPEQTVLS